MSKYDVDYLSFQKCAKCGNPPDTPLEGIYTIFELFCKCGGRIDVDFKGIIEAEKRAKKKPKA